MSAHSSTQEYLFPGSGYSNIVTSTWGCFLIVTNIFWSHSQHRKLLNICSVFISLLFCSHLLCVCFEDHSMRRDFTSAKALLSPSILRLNWCVFYSIPFLYPLFLWFPTCYSFSHFSSTCLYAHCFTVSHHSLSLPPFFLFLPLFAFHQVPGQLYGRRPGWLHERKSSQWHAHHHPAEKVHSAHQDHLSTGQETQTGVASSDGGRRRPGQPTGWGRSGRSSVPRVRLDFFVAICSFQCCCYLLNCLFFCTFCWVTWHLLPSASCHRHLQPSAFIECEWVYVHV